MLIVRWFKLLGAVSVLVATARLIGSGPRRPHDPTQENIKPGNADESGYEPRAQKRSKRSTPHRKTNNSPSPGNERQQRCERRYWVITGGASVVATIATVVAAGFAIGAYNASWKAVGAAQDQAETARSALATSDRPWLAAEYVNHGSLVFQPDGSAQIPFVFALENTGRSPATAVVAAYEAVPAGDSDVEFNLVDRQRKTCRQAEPRPARVGTIVFPNKPIQFPVFVVVSKSQVDDATKRQNVIMSFAVTLCIVYNFGTQAGHTAYFMFIHKKDGRSGFDKTGAETGAKDIQVMFNVSIPADAD